MKTNIKYFFETFNHVNSFDILSYQEVVDLYLKNQTLLNSKFEREGGTNDRPINSDTEHTDPNGFWHGFAPMYFNVDPFRSIKMKHSHAKADVVSMDMKGLGVDWSHFIYLELPKDFFLKYQIAVHSNPDVTRFIEFINEINSENLNNNQVISRLNLYDKKYPESLAVNNFFRKDINPAWRADCEIGQYVSMRNDGVIYPICYNGRFHIINRGTHRALFCAYSGYDIPIFLQYLHLNKKPLTEPWIVELGDYFTVKNVTMEIDIKNKTLRFFSKGELIETYL